MTKKILTEQEETNAELSANSGTHAARLRREAKTSTLRPPNKRRTLSRGRRKNPVVGGIHLRGNKRTLR
jgi:hypothetical protein